MEKDKKNKNEKKNKVEEKSKFDKSKLLKGIGVIAIVIAIIGISFVASKGYGTGADAYEFTDITIDEYLELMQGEDKKIIYIARPTCSYCSLETPLLKQIASQYDLDVYYLDTTNFFDSSINDYTEDGYKLINSHEVYNEGFGTPNTIIVQNGDIVDGVYQYVEASELKDLFERNGLLNE